MCSGLKFLGENPQDRRACGSEFLLDRKIFYKTKILLGKKKVNTIEQQAFFIP